jgi:hypothetical protein
MLGEGLQILAPKLTKTQAQQVLEAVRQQIGKTSFYALEVLLKVLGALPVMLTDEQAQEVLSQLLNQIANPANDRPLRAEFQALAAKLTGAQAQRALTPVLHQISSRLDSYALGTLGEGLDAMAAKLTEAQAQQVLEAVLRQIGESTHPNVLGVLADAVQALAPKLTKTQAQQALAVAMSSLAWATTEDEAVDWAHAVVALLPSTTDQGGTRNLVVAIVYPTAAGPATELLLDAIRARHPDAPAKEAGTAESLKWIAEKYPDQASHPICPTPPQPTSLSGLKCPLSSYSAASTP